jgi:hypothetical protein
MTTTKNTAKPIIPFNYNLFNQREDGEDNQGYELSGGDDDDDDDNLLGCDAV